MVCYYNTYGKVCMSNNYFAELVSDVVQSGFGVAGMNASNMSDEFRSMLDPNFPNKGVQITESDGKLIIQLHIKVSYGLNIAAAVKSITHKVKYVVEEATGLSVRRIDVSVDDIV